MNQKLVTLIAAASDTVTSQSGDLDLGPYVNAGKRQAIGVWAPAITGADTDETYDNKFQEGATTVDSDFADITGAAFTQVTPETTKAFQTIVFPVSKRYLRSVMTIAGTTPGLQNWTGVILQGRWDS